MLLTKWLINAAFRWPNGLNTCICQSEACKGISKENKSFDLPQSEKILEIALLFNRGVEVFGNLDRFIEWLGLENIVLRIIKPKSLLDSTFGINLLKEELTRIEHGILS